MARNKHLTDVERLEIEHGLRHGLSIKKIAAKIGKHHSTVAREICARSVASDKGAFGRLTNRCVLRRNCGKLQLYIYSRPTMGDKVSFDLFAFFYGTGVLESLGMRRVPANEIVLKPAQLG